MASDHTFPGLVQRFFTDYLTMQRNVSPHTIAAYRDSFRLFLRFLSAHLRVRIDQLTLGSLTAEAVLAFLADLENTRRNTPQTRNYRLAAIRAFTRFVLGCEDPDRFIGGHRILAIPVKRSTRPMLGFLTREEVDAVLAAPDLSQWSGRRDQLLFMLLYNTGARISEALQLRVADIQDRVVRLHGKGRKDRAVPLWARTAAGIRRWCRDNRLRSDQYLFLNARGVPLTRQGARFRLRVALRTAAARCPSLAGRRIGLHIFRHSCAMHLLQAGVALEVIALWLGHERPITTHGYVEADLKMKEASLQRLEAVSPAHRPRRMPESRLLSFLEAMDYVNFRPRSA